MNNFLRVQLVSVVQFCTNTRLTCVSYVFIHVHNDRHHWLLLVYCINEFCWRQTNQLPKLRPETQIENLTHWYPHKQHFRCLNSKQVHVFLDFFSACTLSLYLGSKSTKNSQRKHSHILDRLPHFFNSLLPVFFQKLIFKIIQFSFQLFHESGILFFLPFIIQLKHKDTRLVFRPRDRYGRRCGVMSSSSHFPSWTVFWISFSQWSQLVVTSNVSPENQSVSLTWDLHVIVNFLASATFSRSCSSLLSVSNCLYLLQSSKTPLGPVWNATNKTRK